MKIVVTADDFGVDIDRDLGIVLGAAVGAISSISVIVTNRKSYKRMRILINLCKMVNKKINIGLHINLTDKKLLTCDLRDICKIYDEKINPKVVFWKSSIKNKIDLLAIEQEILEQFKVFRTIFNSNPIYVDGHNHCHISNIKIYNSIRKNAEALGINNIRIPYERDINNDIWRILEIYKNSSGNDLHKQLINVSKINMPIEEDLLNLIETMRTSPISDIYLYNLSCDFFNIKFNPSNYFLGTIYGHIRKPSFLIQKLSEIPKETEVMEIMTHPGLILPIKHQTKFSNAQRFLELINLIYLHYKI